jgi:NAD(P)-dependent dehydrogenase (short-subunit alcohol dehydrogenase family)
VAAFLGLLDEGNKRCSGRLKQRSQVIATSSVGAYMRTSPLSSFAYDGSKAAVVHMMKIFSTRFAPYGIRANTLVPGCK